MPRSTLATSILIFLKLFELSGKFKIIFNFNEKMLIFQMMIMSRIGSRMSRIMGRIRRPRLPGFGSDLGCHRLQGGSDVSSETSGIRIGSWIGSRMPQITGRIGSVVRNFRDSDRMSRIGSWGRIRRPRLPGFGSDLRMSQITGRIGCVVRDFRDSDRTLDLISDATDYRPDRIRRPKLPGFGSDVTDYGPDRILGRIRRPRLPGFGSDLGCHGLWAGSGISDRIRHPGSVISDDGSRMFCITWILYFISVHGLLIFFFKQLFPFSEGAAHPI